MLRSEGPGVGAAGAQGTHLAPRSGSPAELLAVAAQQLVGFDQDLAVVRQLARDRLADRAIGRRIALLLLPEAEAEQDPQSVGVEGENGNGAAEEQYFFRGGLSDRRKALETGDRLPAWPREQPGDVSREFFQGDR